jgi:predicted lipoprotein with Yx(FWY)xxD motif
MILDVIRSEGMKKNNQRGYSPIEIFLVVVIVGLIAFIGWYVFHAKSDINTTLGNAESGQTQLPKQAVKKPAASSTTTASQVVVTKTSPTLGQYLADPSNKALYTYGADTAGVSNCTGSCLTDWPVYSAASAPATLPANVTVITRSDGTKQYAYKGMPLYLFTSDSAGQVTGNGIANFSVAKP